MMWKPSVKAIWERAHGTGSTPATPAAINRVICPSSTPRLLTRTQRSCVYTREPGGQPSSPEDEAPFTRGGSAGNAGRLGGERGAARRGTRGGSSPVDDAPGLRPRQRAG